MDVEKFGGFTPPVSNYYRMPIDWINISAKITNLAELKIVQYVLRHTWGFQEYDGKLKPITIDEFMHGRKRSDGTRMDEGTGLSNRSVIDGIRNAIEHGYLICEIDDTDRARIVKAYALNMTTSELDVKILHSKNGCEDSSQLGCNIFTSAVKNLHSKSEESSQRSEKDTKERYSKKDTKERKNGTPSVSAKQEATHASVHPSLSQNKPSSFSQEKQEEEVLFTEEEQAIYDYGCQTIFKAKPPRKTAKLKGECAEIAKHVKTVEQFQSLVQSVRALPYIQGQIHLKNLVNELNGWLQSLEAKPPQASSRRKGSPTATTMSAEEKAASEARTERNLAKLRAGAAAKGVF